MIKKSILLFLLLLLLIPLVQAVPPQITSFTNNKTGSLPCGYLFSQSCDYIVLNSSESINFSATADQVIITWNWYIDNVDQSNNNPSFIKSWSESTTTYTMAKIIKVNGTNAQGMTNTITWTVIVLPLLTSQTITLLNDTGSTELMNAIGTWNFTNTLYYSITPYTNILGKMFWLFLWLIPFSMLWIRQDRITTPSVLGLIVGGIVIGMIPEQYGMFAQLIILLGGAAVIIFAFMER